MKKIVIQGMGFVGLAMATVVANTTDEDGKILFEVVGVDLPSNQKRIDLINEGRLPFKSEDKSFPEKLNKAVNEFENLKATSDENAYKKADVVVVDVQLDIKKNEFGNSQNNTLKKESFETAIKTLGENIAPNCLVLVETTVVPGFTKRLVKNILEDKFIDRGIDVNENPPKIAHSYERVMPGKNYLNSIKNFFRTYSGINKKSAKLAKNFLSKVVNTKEFPLRKENSTEASELAKVLENSYRTVNIALIYEWTLLAEKMEVNLFSVLEGIRKRPTHGNIMNPGFGVGGYCLTKDALLAHWAAENYYDSDFGLPLSTIAIDINDKMPLHTYDLIKENNIGSQKVAILGVSYRENIGDTRNSPTEILYNKLENNNFKIVLHDPYVDKWPEKDNAEFIDKISEIKDYNCIVLATRHQNYLNMTKEEWIDVLKYNSLVVDANNILSDEKIKYLLENNINVVGVGKGHISKMKRRINNG